MKPFSPGSLPDQQSENSAERADAQVSASWAALAAHLTDETSGTRSGAGALFRDWVGSSDRHTRMIDIMHQAWVWPNSSESVTVDTEAALRQVSSRVRIGAGLSSRVGRTPVRRWIGYATGAVLVAVAGVFVFVGGSHLRWTTVNEGVQVFHTSNSQRATMQLSDGSTVVLGPASSVEVRGRQLSLRGQASFHVTQHTRTPFTVTANEVVTTVLGTEFAVKAYDSVTSVAVRSGKVSVGSTVLIEGQRGVVVPAGNIRVEAGRSVDDAFAFMSGKLILHRMTLTEAIPELNRWFDVEVRLGDASLGSKQIETTLGSGSRNDLATMLEFILRARVEQNGRVLTLWTQ